MYLIQSYHLYQFKKNGSGLWFFSICQKMMFTKVVVKCHYHLSCLTMIGPLQLAIHVVQNHHTGEQKSRWDKTNKENYHLKSCMSFVCLVPVRLLLSSVVVLYHVNGKLQRAYYLQLWSAPQGFLVRLVNFACMNFMGCHLPFWCWKLFATLNVISCCRYLQRLWSSNRPQSRTKIFVCS